MKTIIAIVGKTRSGKDTAARYLSKKYNIPMVCSYTTRPKRPYETEGVEHYFISKEEAKTKLKTEHILAYTRNEKTGIEYFATEEALQAQTSIYIINPDGIDYLTKHASKELNLYTICFDIKEGELRRRALACKDDMKVFETRLDSERREFDAFVRSGNYNLLINRGTVEEINDRLHYFMLASKLL